MSTNLVNSSDNFAVDSSLNTEDLLILDESSSRKFLIPAGVLLDHLVSRKTWTLLTDSTAIIDLSDESGPLRIPAFSRGANGPLSLLLRDPSVGAAYFIAAKELVAYEVPALSFPDATRVIRVPVGDAEFNEIHPLQRALLQSSTY